MAAKKINPTLIDEENPEWTDEDFRKARPARVVLREIFPAGTAEALLAPKKGRPPGSGAKSSTTIRLDSDLLAAFKATGKGWQTRINNALREWLTEHKAV